MFSETLYNYLFLLLANRFTQLDTLNLSKNFIRHIENIGHLKRLTTLLLANNHLETADDIRHVLQCPTLQVRRIKSAFAV